MAGEPIDNSMLLSELNSIEHLIDEIRAHLRLNEIAPDWVKSKISVAADELSYGSQGANLCITIW